MVLKYRSGASESWEYENNREKFSGTGYTLGDTNYGSAKIESKEDIKVTITFYKNGFVINDKELRQYDDPQNAEFLNDISNGVVPRELEQLSVRGRHLETHLIDKKGEDYTPPKKKITFDGKGHSLGSTSNGSQVIAGENTVFSLDESKPIVTVQVRFHDGKKAAGKFNKDHRIRDVCAWIEKQQSLISGSRYELVLGYPPTTLNDLNATVEESGIGGAMIVQKLC